MPRDIPATKIAAGSVLTRHTHTCGWTDLNLDSRQVAEMVEMERSKRKEQEAGDKASENDQVRCLEPRKKGGTPLARPLLTRVAQDGPKQESVSWRRHRLLNSTR